jgi:hypothetical protein
MMVARGAAENHPLLVTGLSGKCRGEIAKPACRLLTKRKGRRTMDWLNLISYFFGGVFLCNAIPHIVSGLMGRPFQSPFAKPPGQGSSSTVNVAWGVLNLAGAYILICRVGDFSLRSTAHAATLGLGFLLIGLLLARHFGSFHGGNSPGETNGVSR